MAEGETSAPAEKAAPMGVKVIAGASILAVALAGLGWRYIATPHETAVSPAAVLACGSDAAREALADAVQNNAISNIATLRLLDVQDAKELKFNGRQRLCAGTLVLNSGPQQTRYILSLSTKGEALVVLGPTLDIEAASAALAPEPASAAPPAQGAPVAEPASTPDPDLDRAFQTAFHAAAPAAVTVPDQGDYQFKPYALIPAGQFAALISLGEMPDGSHADGGVVSIHYLAKDASGDFTLERSWPNLLVTGDFGSVGDVSQRTDLLPNPVIQVQKVTGNQGCYDTMVSLIELTPDGPALATVMTASGEDVKGAIQRLDANGFKVVYTHPAGRVVTYVRRGFTFEPTSKIDDLSQC